MLYELSLGDTDFAAVFAVRAHHDNCIFFFGHAFLLEASVLNNSKWPNTATVIIV